MGRVVWANPIRMLIRPLRFALAAAVTLSLGAPAFAAPASPLGLWRTADQGGLVQLFACGAGLCGRIAGGPGLDAHPEARDAQNKDPALRTRLLKGLVFLTGFAGGPAAWSGGQIYRPGNGATYSGSIALVDADTLRLTGCIVRPFCQTQTWHRVK